MADNLQKIDLAACTSSLQGDTAECRRLQKEKYRRHQQLDGLPPWDMASEARFVEFASRVSRGLCFCTVKH